jgi:hypothetical protein
VETVSFWISPERTRGSKSYRSCTSCHGRLFLSDLDSLDFFGTHPRRVLCPACKDTLDSDLSVPDVVSYLRRVKVFLTSADASRPTSAGMALSAMVLISSFFVVSVTLRSVQSAVEAGPFSGLNDMVLVYIEHEEGPDAITPDYLSPYVSYLDQWGNREEWLFDSFLFLSLFSDQKRSFWGPSTAKDWNWWIDKLFQEDRQIDALNQEIERARKSLGKPSKRGVILSIPYPHPEVTNFGLRSESGEFLSFIPTSQGQNRSIENRLEACTWFVQEVVARWETSRYNNLELLGFYWFQEELLEGDADLVNRLAENLHIEGYQLFWIPYNSEENMRALEAFSNGTLLFDQVWIQPNHAFREGVGDRWKERRDLDLIASAAADLGVPIEIELNRDVFLKNDVGALNNFYHYLDGGLTHLYIDQPLAYYVFPSEMYSSPNPVVRDSYYALGDFVKGRHQPVSYVLHCDVGKDDTSSISSSIVLESKRDWGPSEEVDGFSRRLALPEASFVVDGMDPAKDLVVAIRYMTYHQVEVQVRLEGQWTSLGTLIADGQWHTSHWEVESSGGGARSLVFRSTNFTWVSDIWAYPDETIFRLESGPAADGDVGLRSEVIQTDGSWGLVSGDEVFLTRIDPERAWLVGITYRSEHPSRLEMLGGQSPLDLILDASPDWTLEVFHMDQGFGSSEILFRADGDVEIEEMWVSPPELHTNVGTAWDTNPRRHSPGASVGDGWSASRTTSTPHLTTYRSGQPGSSIALSPLGSAVLLTLEYRAEQPVEVLMGNGEQARVVAVLNPADQWSRETIAIAAVGPSGVELRLSAPLDLSSIWVERG